MKNIQNLLIGLFTAIASIVIVIGGVSLALAEGVVPTPAPTEAQPELMMPTFASPVAQLNNQVLPIFTSAPTSTITATIAAPTACPPPKGWQPYTIQIGDTLQTLADRSSISTNKLSQANCLLIDTLLPDTILYIPPVPTATPTVTLTRAPLPSYTSIPCGPPVGWVRYIVQPNDTLYKLSLSLGVSAFQLQYANCLGNSDFIVPGETLFIPSTQNSPAATVTNIPGLTPSNNTASNTPNPTEIPSPSSTPTGGA